MDPVKQLILGTNHAWIYDGRYLTIRTMRVERDRSMNFGAGFPGHGKIMM